MPYDIRTPDPPPGITALAGAELDAVAGGNAWYDVFYGLGETIGHAAREYADAAGSFGVYTYTG